MPKSKGKTQNESLAETIQAKDFRLIEDGTEKLVAMYPDQAEYKLKQVTEQALGTRFKLLLVDVVVLVPAACNLWLMACAL